MTLSTRDSFIAPGILSDKPLVLSTTLKPRVVPLGNMMCCKTPLVLPCAVWPDRECVLNTVESHVLSMVQEEIFYPNGDLDKARDE